MLKYLDLVDYKTQSIKVYENFRLTSTCIKGCVKNTL